MTKFLRNNGLSLGFFSFFLITIFGQAITGFKQYEQQLKELGAPPPTVGRYFSSGHFIEATFENWESEFLQMALFVTLSIFLYQKGSSESKDPDKKEETDREPNPRKKDVPWPVKKGGFILYLYKRSLSLSLFLLFLLSFLLHWYGSLKDFNEKQLLRHEPTQTAFEYLSNSRLWYESFENWQSEFLSVFAIVILSIFLWGKRIGAIKAGGCAAQ